MCSIYRAPNMQMNLRLGKAIQSGVIHRRRKHECGVGLDPGPAEFFLDAWLVLANIGSKHLQRAELFLTHVRIIPASSQARCLKEQATCSQPREGCRAEARLALPREPLGSERFGSRD